MAVPSPPRPLHAHPLQIDMKNDMSLMQEQLTKLDGNMKRLQRGIKLLLLLCLCTLAGVASFVLLCSPWMFAMLCARYWGAAP